MKESYMTLNAELLKRILDDECEMRCCEANDCTRCKISKLFLDNGEELNLRAFKLLDKHLQILIESRARLSILAEMFGAIVNSDPNPMESAFAGFIVGMSVGVKYTETCELEKMLDAELRSGKRESES